jgi:hypothetical protein
MVCTVDILYCTYIRCFCELMSYEKMKAVSVIPGSFKMEFSQYLDPCRGNIAKII